MRIEEILLHLPPPKLNSLNKAIRLGYRERTKAKCSYQEDIGFELAQKQIAPFKCPVYFEWHFILQMSLKKFNIRDGDNFCYVVKLILDAIVRAGIIKNDSFAHIKTPTILHYERLEPIPNQEPEHKVLVRISDVPLYAGELIRRET